MAEPLSDETLTDEMLAAMLADPFEAGLRLVLDEAVEAAAPAVLGEPSLLARAEAAARAVPGGVAPEVLARPAAAVAPVVGEPEGVAVPVRAEAPAVLPERLVVAAERAAAEPVAVPALALPEVPVSRGVAARATLEGSDARPVEVGRLDWGGMEWGRLSEVPEVAAPERAVVGSVAEGLGAPRGVPVTAGWPEEMPDGAAPVMAPWAGMARGVASVPAEGAAREQAAEDEPGGEMVVEGRLEIDGALLGRFVAEYLGREAGRPPSGMTGFDPLVSPVWAGALQG